MKGRLLLAAIAFTLALSICIALAARWSWRQLNVPFKGYPEAQLVFTVQQGDSGAEIVDSLHASGIVRHPRLVRLYLRFGLGDELLKAGEYSFDEPLTAIQVLRRLAEARVLLRSVTIPEGLTLEETAATLSNAGFGEIEAFLASMRSPALIEDLDPQAADLEGYLFPETYAFAGDTSEEEIVGIIVDHCRQVLTERIEPRIDSSPERTLRQVVILASIVEKEVRVDDERPVVAGVYANRLSRNMGLYADPTVIFALKRLGTWNGNLRKRDLELDSPYNTYRYRGLPPGPIASPGLASLVAAARPADVPYLYFVSRNDGTHVFAETLAEHNRNVSTWQKEYWRKRRSEQRRVEDSTDS